MKKQQDLAPSKQCQGARVSGAHGAPAGRGAAPTETCRSGGTAGCVAWECNIAGAARMLEGVFDHIGSVIT